MEKRLKSIGFNRFFVSIISFDFCINKGAESIKRFDFFDFLVALRRVE